MPNLGAGEILAILLVALLVLGPKRLPEVGRKIGGFIRELRHHSDNVKAELRDVIDIDGVANQVNSVRQDFKEAISLTSVIDPTPTPAASAASRPDGAGAPSSGGAELPAATRPSGPTRRMPGGEVPAVDGVEAPRNGTSRVTRRLPIEPGPT